MSINNSALGNHTDNEKSRMLAELLNWRIIDYYDKTSIEDVQTGKMLGSWEFADPCGHGLYADGYTDVARRIFRWSLFPQGKPTGFNEKIKAWFRRHSFFVIMHPMGFRVALDKILECAIEEGMVSCKK